LHPKDLQVTQMKGQTPIWLRIRQLERTRLFYDMNHFLTIMLLLRDHTIETFDTNKEFQTEPRLFIHIYIYILKRRIYAIVVVRRTVWAM
jgi:hypothetical protein